MKICARCKKELDWKLEIMRSTSCPHCRADLRTCTNCVFYLPGAHWDCRETVGEMVADKEKANFCDWFKFRETKDAPADARSNGRDREDFNKLFGSD